VDQSRLGALSWSPVAFFLSETADRNGGTRPIRLHSRIHYNGHQIFIVGYEVSLEAGGNACGGMYRLRGEGCHSDRVTSLPRLPLRAGIRVGALLVARAALADLRASCTGAQVWERVVAAPAEATLAQQQAGVGAGDAARIAWRCRHVGFYRGQPIEDVQYSSDGSLLAVASSNVRVSLSLSLSLSCNIAFIQTIAAQGMRPLTTPRAGG